MNADAIKSEDMTPHVEEKVHKWKCRHCKHKWPIENLEAILNEELRPRQCPNRECRAMDWDRPKKLEGRPRTEKSKPKSKSAKRRK